MAKVSPGPACLWLLYHLKVSLTIHFGKLKVCAGFAQGSRVICLHVKGGNSDHRNNLYLSLVDIG